MLRIMFKWSWLFVTVVIITTTAGNEYTDDLLKSGIDNKCDKKYIGKPLPSNMRCVDPVNALNMDRSPHVKTECVCPDYHSCIVDPKNEADELTDWRSVNYMCRSSAQIKKEKDIHKKSGYE